MSEVTNARDQDLACNVGGESGAALVASAAAGGVVKFEWTNVKPVTSLLYIFNQYSRLDLRLQWPAGGSTLRNAHKPTRLRT